MVAASGGGCSRLVWLAFLAGLCVGGLVRTLGVLRPVAAPAEPPTVADGLVLEDGFLWSDSVERALPPELEPSAWSRYVNGSRVVKLEPGCGRMQNRLATFEDGRAACCRYRVNTDQIQGELLSFLLGRELGLRSLAPTTALLARGVQWGGLQGAARWSPERAVVLTEFLEGLQPAPLPSPLRDLRRLLPEDVADAGVPPEVLAQWSDLIVFDFLTANLDRLVNNLHNEQWNRESMRGPAHNLALRQGGGALVFLDNESGLLHGYRRLSQYDAYHRAMLEGLCVFRRPTVEHLRRLERADVGAILKNAMRDGLSPSVLDAVPPLPSRNVAVLQLRLRAVLDQVESCRERYRG